MTELVLLLFIMFFKYDRLDDEIDKPITEGAVSRALVILRSHEGSDLHALAHFTLHDLRRSAATAWAEHLKVDPHIIERMLNHQPENRLIATYQRAAYVDEQKSAWADWGKMIEHRIAREPDNATPITVARRHR